MSFKPRSLLSFVITIAIAIAFALLIQAFIVKPYRIPSPSMVPTLQIGQRVLVDRLSMHWRDPSVGKVVVFRPPEGAVTNNVCGQTPAPGAVCDQPTRDRSKSQYFVKRIIAGPGDRFKMVNGRVFVNDKPLDEPYARPCLDQTCNFPTTVTIPKDHYFMMGDNRDQSADSRYWGPVPRDWIIGEAFATYWPPSRIGGVD